MTNQKGFFSIAELLISLFIIVIVATFTLLYMNPFEINKRARDAVRLADLANLQQAINLIILEKSNTNPFLLCYNLAFPCSESSYPQNSNTNKRDGRGWVKINFSDGKSTKNVALPVDPLNNGSHNYTYTASGFSYEINAVLESERYLKMMAEDGGNNDTRLEVGNKLNLID